MQRLLSAALTVFLTLCLTACGSLTTRDNTPPSGIDGVACMLNQVNALPEAIEVSDAALLAQALGASLKGGICSGKAFKTEKPLRVYRLWDANVAASQFGSWWALGKPAGSREAYRQDYAICPSWSALNRLTSCTVKLGAVIVIGSTQSVQCEDGTFAVSPSSQVFMQNNAAAGQLAVENCQDEGQWP
ncbi:MAG: hypothetical protein Q7T07_20000 [Burkholderiaceae bacterium]|nr:hypothetical protein [Burkholderiaceae bacterium]